MENKGFLLYLKLWKVRFSKILWLVRWGKAQDGVGGKKPLAHNRLWDGVVGMLHLSEGCMDEIKLRNTQLHKIEVILVRCQLGNT